MEFLNYITENLLTTLLQAVITVAVPILSTFAVKWLQTKTSQVATRTDNEKAQAYIQEALDAASTAVAYTCQTYVDALKDSSEFTVKNQKEALNKAKETALSLLSKSATDFLNATYGDVTSYLTTQIEKEVHFQKNSATLLLGDAIEAYPED